MTNNNLVKIDIASQFMREHGMHHWVFQWRDETTIYQMECDTGNMRHKGIGAGCFWTDWI